MILIGQYDSPFVRRTAIALRLYGMSYEHRPWSVWADADKIAPYNPLLRVPTLVLDDGEVLIESAAILAYLDEVVGPDRALMASSGPARRQALKVCALAAGMAEKAVSLLYEELLHPQMSERWDDRCRAQIGGTLRLLELERTGARDLFWFGAALSHADIAVACAIRFIREAHPAAFDPQAYPALAAHAARCEALPVFGEITQLLIVAGRKS